jgi:hypothetical protein
MLKAATVSYFHEDAFRAGREAARELLDELGAPPDLVLLFASAHLDPERVVAGITQELPPETRLVGCSSCAEIDGREALTGSITLMGMGLGRAVRCETFRLEGPVADPVAAGRAFGERVRAVEPAMVFLFPDGLALNNTRFLSAMQETLGAHLPIVGGVPSDMGRFVRTTEFEGRSAFAGGVVAAALSGPVDVVTAAEPASSPWARRARARGSRGAGASSSSTGSLRSPFTGITSARARTRCPRSASSSRSASSAAPWATIGSPRARPSRSCARSPASTTLPLRSYAWARCPKGRAYA